VPEVARLLRDAAVREVIAASGRDDSDFARAAAYDISA